MPYNNVPSDKTAAMESCVAQVQADGKPKQAAIAICYSSIVGKKVLLSPYPVPDVPIGDLIPPEGGDPLSWQQVSKRTDEWAQKQLSRREAAARARCAVQGCTASPTQLVTVKGAVLPYCEEHLPGAKDVLARHSIKVEGVRSAEQVWVDASFLAQDEKDINTVELGYDEKQEHTGAILALKPPPYIADEVAVDSGLSPTELHVTLVYLGETANLDKDEFLILAERLAQAVHPFTAKLDGTIRFAEGAVALNVNAPYIPELRQQLVETLRGLGHEVTDIHGFTPHLTVGFEEDGVEIEPRLPTEPECEFNELWLFWGGEQVAFPMLSRKGNFITKDGQVIFVGGPGAGGGGTTGSTGGQASYWTNPSGATTNSKSDIVQFLAANGIPESDVVFSGSTRGIDGHPVLAEIDVRNNKIVVSEQAMKAKGDIRPVLVHEMMHLRTMNNGELAQKVKATVGQEQWEKGYWNSMNNAGAVSEYATWHIGRSPGNLIIKEHLAEVARLDYEGKLSTVPSGWANLYHQVMAGNE